MNTQIVKLFGVVLVLYALLLGFTSYWSIFDASSLNANRHNKRELLVDEQIDRGDIKADDGTVIAHSTPVGRGDNRVYVRHYPLGELFGNPIGYSFVQRGRVQFELSHNDELVGNKTEFLSILDQLQGHRQEGNAVVTSLDPTAQRIATEDLAGRPGAAVAIVPDTGEVKAMVSVPGYDPNLIPNNADFKALNTADPPAIVNRATQSLYPPGSTMKVVTATAALDSGDFSPGTVLSGASPQVCGGVPLSNAGGENFGDIDMTTALTNSVNTYWCQVGEKVGSATMFKYMDRFGFNSKPDIDLPSFQLAASGVYDNGHLLNQNSAIDIGRVAIGQERLLVTPLQMAEVAATVANDGERMCPRLWDKVVDPEGRVDKLDPISCGRVMSSGTAAELTDMMTKVVQEGTGTAAALSGVDVAGKTGTAELGVRQGCAEPNQAWFIGFAPADHPRIAAAATVECTSGFGGDTAGPIVRDIMEALLNG